MGKIRLVRKHRGKMTDEVKTPAGNRASIVALGILSSRVLGLIRWSLMARYFGSGAHADVLRAAFQAPNALQNLLGEGTMSAAFIPVYSKMIEEGKPEAAGRFAGSILGLLTAVVCFWEFGWPTPSAPYSCEGLLEMPQR